MRALESHCSSSFPEIGLDRGKRFHDVLVATKSQDANVIHHLTKTGFCKHKIILGCGISPLAIQATAMVECQNGSRFLCVNHDVS